MHISVELVSLMIIFLTIKGYFYKYQNLLVSMLMLMLIIHVVFLKYITMFVVYHNRSIWILVVVIQCFSL